MEEPRGNLGVRRKDGEGRSPWAKVRAELEDAGSPVLSVLLLGVGGAAFEEVVVGSPSEVVSALVDVIEEGVPNWARFVDPGGDELWVSVGAVMGVRAVRPEIEE